MATIGVDITQILVSTAIPQYQVGTLGVVEDITDGSKYFLYCHASEVITAAGYLCLVSSSFEIQMVDATSSAPGVGQGLSVGAAMAAFLDNEFGWIQVYGKGSLRTLASAAVGTDLTSSSTPGAVDDATTAGLEVMNGLSLGTASGGSAETNADAYFNWPAVGRTL